MRMYYTKMYPRGMRSNSPSKVQQSDSVYVQGRPILYSHCCEAIHKHDATVVVLYTFWNSWRVHSECRGVLGYKQFRVIIVRSSGKGLRNR